MLAATPKILAGTRVGLVREFFIKPLPNNVAINDKIDAEVKAVLRDQLGAELVESVDALYADDPTVPNMKFTFQDSIAEVLPITAPEYFAQKVGDQLEFAVPGWDVTSKDYLVALSLHEAPLSAALNLRRLTSGGLDNAQRTPFLMDRYLKARADRLVTDWPSFVANASFFAENLRSGSLNVAELDNQNIAATSGSDRLKMVTAARMIVGSRSEPSRASPGRGRAPPPSGRRRSRTPRPPGARP